jgi:hypothetical protein
MNPSLRPIQNRWKKINPAVRVFILESTFAGAIAISKEPLSKRNERIGLDSATSHCVSCWLSAVFYGFGGKIRSNPSTRLRNYKNVQSAQNCWGCRYCACGNSARSKRLGRLGIEPGETYLWSQPLPCPIRNSRPSSSLFCCWWGWHNLRYAFVRVCQPKSSGGIGLGRLRWDGYR